MGAVGASGRQLRPADPARRGAALYVAWVLGTIVGVLAGDVLGDPGRLGLDAAFPALFLALLVGELRSRRAVAAAVAGGAIALALVPFARRNAARRRRRRLPGGAPPMSVWTVVAAVGAGTVALKALGPGAAGWAPTARAPRRRDRTLLAPTVLAALVVTQTFGDAAASCSTARGRRVGGRGRDRAPGAAALVVVVAAVATALAVGGLGPSSRRRTDAAARRATWVWSSPGSRVVSRWSSRPGTERRARPGATVLRSRSTAPSSCRARAARPPRRQRPELVEQGGDRQHERGEVRPAAVGEADGRTSPPRCSRARGPRPPDRAVLGAVQAQRPPARQPDEHQRAESASPAASSIGAGRRRPRTRRRSPRYRNQRSRARRRRDAGRAARSRTERPAPRRSGTRRSGLRRARISPSRSEPSTPAKAQKRSLTITTPSGRAMPPRRGASVPVRALERLQVTWPSTP